MFENILYKIANQIKNNPKLVKNIIKFQSILRGYLTRKTVSQYLTREKNTLTPNVSSTRFVIVTNSKITDEEIQKLTQLFNNLEDTIKSTQQKISAKAKETIDFIKKAGYALEDF